MVLVPVVIGVVEVIKQAGNVSSRYAPLLSLVLGCLGVYLASGFALTGALVLEGIVVGLSAAGLYSGAKKTFGQ